MEINQVNITRILNPTSIDLGDYVINPYKGCSYGCLYCYVRFNKVTMKESRKWGEYVDARVNAPELLLKELQTKKPERVLLGSTTECFSPEEKKFRLTEKILKTLNGEGVYYSILTRSPIIEEYIPLLNKGYCENIYFTINNLSDDLKNMFEPRTPDFMLRVKAINALLENGINVVPYFSPIFPFVSKFNNIFNLFPKSDRVDFEGLNFNLGNIDQIIKKIEKVNPKVATIYKEMKRSKTIYEGVWSKAKKDIMKEAIKNKKNHSVYIHGLNEYFLNKYR